MAAVMFWLMEYVVAVVVSLEASVLGVLNDSKYSRDYYTNLV